MATVGQTAQRCTEPPVETQPCRTAPTLPPRSVPYAARVLFGSVAFEAHEKFTRTADINRLFGLVV
jgi:hypothetical protein